MIEIVESETKRKLVRAANACGDIDEKQIISDLIKSLIGYNLLDLEIMRRYTTLYLREEGWGKEAKKYDEEIFKVRR